MNELTLSDETIRAFVILTTPAEYAQIEASASAAALEHDRAEAA